MIKAINIEDKTKKHQKNLYSRPVVNVRRLSCQMSKKESLTRIGLPGTHEKLWLSYKPVPQKVIAFYQQYD